MEEERQVIYYDDEKNDEFSTAQITPKTIDENYQYIYRGFFKKFTRFFWYRVVATPIAIAYLHKKFRHKIIGKELLPPKGTAFFLYGNHTQATADALIPTMICRPRSVYVIVHPNNVSMPYLGRVTPSLGALPLPDNYAATRNFTAAIKTRVSEGNIICIYPEAHIWPYYTKIRDFPDTSFGYPIQHNTPVYCFTNTYQKRKNGDKIQLVTYVDGPFYADSTLSKKAAREKLRGEVYAAMTARAQSSNVEKIHYIKRTECTANGGENEHTVRG